MSEDLERLKDDYRRIEAPPYLAMRIAALAAERRARRRRWPALAAAAGLTAAVLAVVTLIPPERPVPAQAWTAPSYARLSRMTPDRPPMAPPGLGSLKGVTTPAMPPKPALSRPQTPQSFFDTGDETRKETENEYA